MVNDFCIQLNISSEWFDFNLSCDQNEEINFKIEIIRKDRLEWSKFTNRSFIKVGFVFNFENIAVKN